MENSAHSFLFRNIKFGYNDTTVVKIDSLELPATGMIFIVGPSGVGKSTFLESMGLMSNAFLNFDRAVSTFSIRGEALDPPSLWTKNNAKLTSIREAQFSFIFQSTNLMPNFSILENILIAANFAKEEYEATIEQIKVLLEEMSLPLSILERYPYEISGGQKQRVAFIRALVGEFTILLADEPTGNLDFHNSKSLFKVLSKHIHSNKKAAIIVTHHLELAQEYGDQIIEIVASPEGVGLPRIYRQETFVETGGKE